MTRTIPVALLLLLCGLTGIAHAEPVPAWPVEHRATARAISDGLVWGQIGAEVLTSALTREHRGKALWCSAARIGLAVGVAELTKAIVHRTRPDGSDQKSFFSEHTAVAMSASGWRYGVGITVGLSTGYFRMAAGRHYPTDVAVGAAVGLAASRVCR